MCLMVDEVREERRLKMWKSPTATESFTDFLRRSMKDCPVDLSLLDEPGADFDEAALLRSFGLLTQKERPSLADTEKAIMSGGEARFAALLSQGGCVPAKESARAVKRRRKEERAQKLDGRWFGMPRQDVTATEAEHDLEVLTHRRGVIDTKSNFYKKNDRRNPSRYFQIGEVISPAAEFFQRPTKKARKRGIADALLNDAEFMTKLKKEYKSIKKREAMKKGPPKQKKKDRKFKKRF